jgi:outer membrane receptor protein involved in Fe transport
MLVEPTLMHAPAQAQDAIDITLPTVTILGATPLLGSGIDRDTVPAASTSLRTRDLTRAGTVPQDAVRTLNETIGGANLDSASGNPYQPTLFFHGFAASALQGTAQGLAVYVNGIRFNQAFGDTVNFDLLPNMAIERLDVEGSNPVFGLNALGGSVNIRLRDGFTWQGAEAEVTGGSFGTVGGDFQWGQQSGNTATYVAGGVKHQGGWRDQQSSDLQTLYGDIGWRGRAVELHLNTLLAHSALNGPGTSPVELLAAAPAAQFTAPNFIGNRFAQISLSGSVDLTDTLSIQAVSYYSNFLQRVSNGNAPNDTPCNDGSGLLCNDSGVSTTLGGGSIPAFLGADPLAYAELDTQTTNTDRYGVSAQVTDTGGLFGLKNHFVAGASYDGATTMFTASAAIGGIDPGSRDFLGPGVVIDEPGVNAPVRVSVGDAYYGVFVTDTLNLTDSLAVTASGRFNLATIDLSDRNGGDISGNHTYRRFNPAIGLTYKLAPWLSVYAGYAEANRAPTPAELSCAGPADSCSLANFFVGDPNLKQVIAHTIEAGLRGAIAFGNDRMTYDIGFYRTDLDDDIAFVNTTTLNRAFFTNIGQTQRQGVDMSLRYTAPRWSAWIAYAYTNATYRSGFTEAAGSNPAADASGNITINPGNQLPGVPAHQGKLGMSWRVTDDWTVAAVLVAQSGQYLFGDEANLTAKLPAFFSLNLSTLYQVTPHVALFGSIDNATDQRFYTYGTFAPTSSVYLAQAPGATNPRAYSPAAPIGVFGGVRVRF